MDVVILLLLGLGALAGASLFGGDDDASPDGEGIGGSSEPGLGGQAGRRPEG